MTEPWIFLACTAPLLGELLFQDQRTIEAEEAVKVRHCLTTMLAVLKIEYRVVDNNRIYPKSSRCGEFSMTSTSSALKTTTTSPRSAKASRSAWRGRPSE